MTDDDKRLIEYFESILDKLPKGHINFSAFESTDDPASMVRGAIDRMRRGGQEGDTSAGVLRRLATYLPTLREGVKYIADK
ncbi:hypothetical protein [Fibrella forsythiae]|uniref:Uncharacterized protein n=1 Tax=Fibrella forsythiae TaxID=2817061 RepID=A0ABS3JDM1_9BACT|nr:hypothetical protein [Fibrella forsythiae]MBO0947548.1 hypothetical protein [Fibrella forsythiae]